MVSRAAIDMLVGIKMTAMAAEWSSQLQDSFFNELGFKDRLGLLVTAEWNRRQTNTVTQLIYNAHFAALEKVVDRLCDMISSLTAAAIHSITARSWISACFN